MNDISYKIFMCCHKDFELLPQCYTPIQCGRAINPPIDGITGDDTGDNISRLNHEYCELTAYYHAWKNEDLMYYGFCHYRRFFGMDGISNRPYLAMRRLSKRRSKQLLVNEKIWDHLVREYDIIAPRSENMGIKADDYYRISRFHYGEDLDLFIQILKRKYPMLSSDADEYLSQNKQFFCNMFVMKKEFFFEYCEILFSVLKEFDSQKILHQDFQSDRTDGYLGEVFTGIYLFSLRKKGAKIKELLRIDTQCDYKKLVAFVLFPPESRIRFFVKRVIKKLR